MAIIARRLREIDMIFDMEHITDVTTHPLFAEWERLSYALVETLFQLL